MQRQPIVTLLVLGALLTVPMTSAQVDTEDPIRNGGLERSLPGGDEICQVAGNHEANVPPAPFPVAHVDTCDPGPTKALAWASRDGTTFEDVDGDGDREALITQDSAHHNLWQSGEPKHVPFSGDFPELTFRLEAGSIDGKVIVSFTDAPMETQSPWVGGFVLCQITFDKQLLQSNLAPDGTVAVPPTDASFQSRYQTCDDAAAAWGSSTDDERRDILGRLRLIQVSFWGFESGATDAACGCTAQIDDVSLAGARTIVDEASEGNVRPHIEL